MSSIEIKLQNELSNVIRIPNNFFQKLINKDARTEANIKRET